MRYAKRAEGAKKPTPHRKPSAAKTTAKAAPKAAPKAKKPAAKASSATEGTKNISSYARVVVAGLRGGSGKTTLSVGLAQALSRKGLSVATYKKGPDYIDAGWLAMATGQPCYNLDPFMIGPKSIEQSFLAHSRGADVSVIEGNRGLFDGMDAEGSMSTSSVARTLKAPVLLIIDCTKSTRSSAAVVLGAKNFERGLDLAGVVLNNVSSRRHREVTTEAIEKYTGVPVLGALPRLRGSELPERHMGLTPWQEHPAVQAEIKRLADFIEEHVDLARVLKIARSAPKLDTKKLASNRATHPLPSALDMRPVIGVVRDSAFQFYYEENLEALRELGAEVVFISALSSTKLPPLDALYIGGGFPETHALRLSDNAAFRACLKESIQAGLPVYAECGGLMYLGESIELEGRVYPMAGVFPLKFRLRPRPDAHGYTWVVSDRANPYFGNGVELKGHEFHYSEVMNPEALDDADNMSLAFGMKRGKGIAGGRDGLCYKNAFATYTHLHAVGSPEWAEGLVGMAMRYKASRLPLPGC